jgi:hypothetical protein
MKEALKMALEALNDLAAWHDGEVGGHMDEPYSAEVAREAITAVKAALEAKDEPFGFFQYDIRLDAWVQNRINNKGVAFYIKEKNNE